MTPGLDGAVELLERSLAYARVVLADVTDADLGRATPCARWTLGGLLAHMEDALDAFTEAADGLVRVDRPPTTGTRVEDLREKACALLAAWTRATAGGPVLVGDAALAAPVLVAAAALEVAVHGWDVGRATGRGGPLPEDLARGLLGVADQVVAPADRGVRFAPARAVPTTASYGERLVAFLGRQPAGPLARSSPEAGTSGRAAS